MPAKDTTMTLIKLSGMRACIDSMAAHIADITDEQDVLLDGAYAALLALSDRSAMDREIPSPIVGALMDIRLHEENRSTEEIERMMAKKGSAKCRRP